MKIDQIDEGVGRIVKGVNTTPDVGPNQISKEAAKFGFKVDKDGRPPVITKKAKNNPNTLFNLGLTEGLNPLSWFEGGLANNPEYKAWKRMYVRNPQRAEMTFRKKHKEFLAYYNDKEEVTSSRQFTDYEMALMEGGHSIEEDKPKELGDIFSALMENEIARTTEIFVDMDGVLADFFTEWKKLIGQNWRDITDIKPALQKIRDTENFWLDLPMTPNAQNLLNLIKDLKGEYNILSSPLPDDPNSEPHKREWIENHLNFFPPKRVIITHDKARYATQRDGTPNILIDDYGVNVRNWEAAGGVGFKYKDHKFERTVDAIKQHMQEPVEENFADGKKKGKSRPGRVKKAGASCKGSVTSLRKKAKKYSGERGKMYHWCANMKSGRGK